MLLHVVIPRRELLVANRPVDGDTVLCVDAEVEVAPAVALASPCQRTAADLIAAIPVEPLHLRVGRLLLIDPEGEVLLVEQVPLEHLVSLFHRCRSAASMQVFPRRLGGVDVILDVLDVAASLQEQDAKPFLREIHCRPSTRYAGADHNRVVACRLHRVSSRSLSGIRYSYNQG